MHPLQWWRKVLPRRGTEGVAIERDVRAVWLDGGGGVFFAGWC